MFELSQIQLVYRTLLKRVQEIDSELLIIKALEGEDEDDTLQKGYKGQDPSLDN